MMCSQSMCGLQLRSEQSGAARDKDDLFSLVSLIPGRNKLVITFLQSWTRYKNLIYDYTAYKLWYIQISTYHQSRAIVGSDFHFWQSYKPPSISKLNLYKRISRMKVRMVMRQLRRIRERRGITNIHDTNCHTIKFQTIFFWFIIRFSQIVPSCEEVLDWATLLC